MSHLSSRNYKSKKDFQIILKTLTRIRPPDHLIDYPVKADIEENLVSAATRANTRLWFDDDQLVGWAYVDEFNNLNWELDRQYEELLGREIVEWGESCVQKSLITGRAGSLDTNCREDYVERISFLHRHGFQRTGEFNISMRRQLSEPIPEPQLTPGFSIRPMVGAHEAEAVAAMHRAAFDTDYMTTEKRLVIMSTSEYDPSLDLVVVAPDGTIAANCICSVNKREGTGNTDPIATHPRFQRMGLARALLLTGLRLLKERSMTFAHLGTSGNNIAMQKAAESVGFVTESKSIWFSKEVT
jgi:GNAT superfamily N-acetyltransferase